MLRLYLKIWDWDLIFGRAVKAISSLGVRSPCLEPSKKNSNGGKHGLRTPREEISFTDGRKFNPNPKFLGTAEAIFCLPHQPNFSDIFDLCLHWVSVVRGGKDNR